jgi:hypothetical protein
MSDRSAPIALMMETASTSETFVNFYQTTRRYNPEDSHLLGIISLNSINQLIYAMDKCCVFSEVWTKFLNII